MFREIVMYIWNPVFREPDKTASLRTKLRFVGVAWVVAFCAFMICVTVILMTDYYVVHVLHQPAVTDTLNKKTSSFDKWMGGWAFPVIVLIGPFFEECIFRLPLNLRKKYVAAFAFLFFYWLSDRYLRRPYLMDLKLDMAIITGAVAALLVWYKLPQEWLDAWKGKYFRYLFYISAFYFGLIHISNFYQPNFPATYLYPLYTLPQMTSGAILGAVRMRYGFLYGLLLHGLINLPPALVHVSELF